MARDFCRLLAMLCILKGCNAFIPPIRDQRILSLLREDLNSDTCPFDDENDAAACLLGEGYVQAERIEPVTQIFVAKLEKLSDRFESSQKTNLIR